MGTTLLNKFSLTLLLLGVFVSLRANDNVLYIQNSKIKLGVNLDLGGAITYLSETKSSDNMINNFDWGRQIQMSFYSGPIPYIPESGQQPQERWAFLGWNPIQSGDVGGYRSKVVDFYHGEDSIYVKSIPMQWPLANVSGECFFESSVKINANIVQVFNRIRNDRKDKTQYPARSQELPAVYVNAPYHHLVTYKGDRPFKNEAISEIPQISETEPVWSHWQSTENWAAHLNDDNFGLGIYTPDVQSFIGGFYGKKGIGETTDSATGYFAPILQEILDYNIVYDCYYYLCVGSIKEIRDFATLNRTIQTSLKYSFKKDRNHFYYTDALDAGWPIQNSLKIKPKKKIIFLNGPQTTFKLGDTFRFKLRGQFPKNVQEINLICVSLDGKSESEYNLPILNDNQLRNYVVMLNNKFAEETLLGQIKIRIEFSDINNSTFLHIEEFEIN